jgi:hypothetical protein
MVSGLWINGTRHFFTNYHSTSQANHTVKNPRPTTKSPHSPGCSPTENVTCHVRPPSLSTDMKTPLLPILFLLLTSLTADAKRPTKNTAHYLRGHAEQLVDTRVTVDVAFIQPLRLAVPRLTGYTTLRLHTWDENEEISGGVINLLVPEHAAPSLIKKYGASPDIKDIWPRKPDTRSLNATLRLGPANSLYLDYDGTAAAAAAAAKSPSLLEQIRNALANKP